MGVSNMLQKSKVIIAIFVICLSSYLLITKNFELVPYLMLTLAIFMLVTGLVEHQRNRKGFWGYLSILVSLFILFVSLQGFFLN
ncbi:DUF3953 domain-containing protein [Paenibacillus anseongensis]|uniref:DUF3953 domain-containing protein n=1 Tax=Paenibacillus TaxID=44249 RepID=UPI002867D24C|nr:DUF3953 domain-containing protein [Paenibacillus sp. CGMCC 1.16610]